MEASEYGAMDMPGGDEGVAPLLSRTTSRPRQSVLGAMMVSEAAIDPVMGEVRLKAEDFYRDRHGTIYR